MTNESEPSHLRFSLMVGELWQRGWRVGGAGGVAVLALVADDQHRRVHGVALHVLARRAPAHGAALVVAPDRRRRRWNSNQQAVACLYVD
jgi:hypothetical protein